jgi:DNA-binding NarL/FixJ family response regulator
MSVKILIVDDHEVVRQGVRSIISKMRPQWEVCGEASNGEEAIQAAEDLSPDIVLLDITMPVMNGFNAAPRIAKLGHPILIFTMHESETLETDVRRSGASGYVLKSQAVRDLILAIERVLAGGTFFGPEIKSPKTAKIPNLGVFLRAALCFE